MLKVTTTIHNALGEIEPAITIFYDGDEYSIVKFDDYVYEVGCKLHNGGWKQYGLFRTIAECCSAIFWDTVTAARTECGRPTFDMFGNMTGIVPLTYYDTPAEPETFELPAWVFDDFDDETLDLLDLLDEFDDLDADEYMCA